MSQLTLLVSSIACLALPSSPPGPGVDPAGFRSGDLLYASNILFGISTGNTGILRIDPVTGQSEVVLGPVWAGSGSAPNFAYDPYRDRLITSVSLDGVSTDVYLVDADGGTESVGMPGQIVNNFAPTGDGRVYMTIGLGLAADIHYIDAGGALHQLLDEAGSAPFQLDPLAGNGAAFSGMIYEPGVNALFVATFVSTFVCGASDSINLYKIPLSPDGSRLSSPVECTDFDVNESGLIETPEGWSRGPEGDLFLVVDTDSGAEQPRMLRVDPDNLAVTPYASNGGYFGTGATNSGCYSHVRGKGAIVDGQTPDIRLFSEGEAGPGTLLSVVTPPGTSLSGNGQQATLTEIGPAGPHDGLIGSPLTLSVSAGGTQNFSLRIGAPFAGELYLLLGSLTGWNPTTPVGPAQLPLVLDSYTIFTIKQANSAVLQASFGTLGAQGDANAALVVPPGAVGASAVGLVAYHSALVLDANFAALAATNALPLELVP